MRILIVISFILLDYVENLFDDIVEKGDDELIDLLFTSRPLI